MSLLNIVTYRKMECMIVTLNTSRFEMSLLNDEAPGNMPYMSFARDTSHLLEEVHVERFHTCTLEHEYILLTFDTFHFDMSLSNIVTYRKMECMIVTLDTSHFEMSLLNDDAPGNMSYMSFTRDTSHLRCRCRKSSTP